MPGRRPLSQKLRGTRGRRQVPTCRPSALVRSVVRSRRTDLEASQPAGVACELALACGKCFLHRCIAPGIAVQIDQPARWQRPAANGCCECLHALVTDLVSPEVELNQLRHRPAAHCAGQGDYALVANLVVFERQIRTFVSGLSTLSQPFARAEFSRLVSACRLLSLEKLTELSDYLEESTGLMLDLASSDVKDILCLREDFAEDDVRKTLEELFVK